MKNRFVLTDKNKAEIIANAKLYLLVPTLIYLGVVLKNLDNGFEIQDFYVNNTVIGAMISYVIAQIISGLNKWQSKE